MFVSGHDPNLKGNVAELKIATEAAVHGISVLKPMTEHARYDLVFEIGGDLKRIQCKTARLRGEVVALACRTNRRGPNGFITTRYTPEEIDAVAAYCPELDRVLLRSDQGNPRVGSGSTCGSLLHVTAKKPRYTSRAISALGL